MQSYLGRMMSTAWPRFSSSRLRPKMTSPNPPACATGAHSVATITMNTLAQPPAPSAGSASRMKRASLSASLSHLAIAVTVENVPLTRRTGSAGLLQQRFEADRKFNLHRSDCRELVEPALEHLASNSRSYLVAGRP